VPHHKKTSKTKPTQTSSKIQKSTKGREHAARSLTAALLSGSLGDELKKHAFERCRHFFLYLITIKAIEHVNNTLSPKAPITALSGLEVKATDQIDTGFIQETAHYEEFDNTDEHIVDQPTTSFTKMDAAHFCNLGIKHSFAGKLDLKNAVLRDLHAALKVYAGNTRLLPKRVNIGPDKKIDTLHGKLAREILGDGQAICSRGRINDYVIKATLSLNAYARANDKKKKGVAACARCYIAAYAQDGFVDQIFGSIQSEAVGWCAATGYKAEALLISHL
jgi:hypothetical protein